MWLVLCCLLLASPACSNPSRQDEDTGLRGQVLRGPTAPGPEQVGSSDEAPFSALFHVLDGDDVEVARFESEEDGRFAIALAPGAYVVVPDESAPLLFPTRQRRDVTVPEDGHADVVLRFDTGLR